MKYYIDDLATVHREKIDLEAYGFRAYFFRADLRGRFDFLEWDAVIDCGEEDLIMFMLLGLEMKPYVRNTEFTMSYREWMEVDDWYAIKILQNQLRMLPNE